MFKRRKGPQEEVLRHIRPQTKVDLILHLDLLRDRIDVRSTIVYEMDEERLILAQTDPPVVKSMVGGEVEATFLLSGRGTGPRRWAYETVILDVIPNYRLHRADQLPQPAIFIGAPKVELYESNVRLDYRIPIKPKDGVSIRIRAAVGRVTLMDLSVGGVMVSFPGVTELKEGEKLGYMLSLPDEYPIQGEAEIRRVIPVGRPVRNTMIGLKFMKLEVSAVRTLQRLVNRLMLKAQRAKFEMEEAAAESEAEE